MIRFLTTIFFCLPACFSFAQSAFSGGFYAGITGSQVDGDKYYGFNKGGFTIGATAQYPLSPKFLAALEINFIQKGAQSRSIVNTGGIAFPNIYNLRVNYAEIPLMVKFYDRKSFGLGVGASYNRVIGTPKQFRDPFVTPQVKGVEQFNDYDISTIGEASYYFNPTLQMNLRYTYGWTPMGYSSASDYEGGRCFNKAIVVRVGYIFGQDFDEKRSRKE